MVLGVLSQRSREKLDHLFNMREALVEEVLIEVEASVTIGEEGTIVKVEVPILPQ